MTKILDNTRIGTRISLALALPVLGLLFFSGFTAVDRFQTAREMGRVLALADLAPTISALVPELQKESGASAGFIGSKGKKFTKKLPEQRLLTDDKHETLQSAFKTFDASAFGDGLAGKMATATEALAELAAVRARVSSLEISVPEMAGYYTPTIGKLLSIVEEMALLSSNIRVTQSITAYTAFLQGKERAGIERAMGSGGFSAGEFRPAIYRRFLQLIAMQETFLSRFAIFATAEQKAFLADTVAGTAVDEVERMRKIAIESPVTGSTAGVEGPYWFDTITEKINLLKSIEDKIAGDLRDQASSIEAEAYSTFVVLAGAIVVLLVLTAVLVTAIIRGITGPLDSMTGVMSALAAGDTSVEVSGTGRGDEIGHMADAVQVFRQNRIDADRLEREQKEERVAKEIRQREVNEYIRQFELTVMSILESLSRADATMRQTATQMTAGADDTLNQARSVASASNDASENVQTVASAVEEAANGTTQVSTSISQVQGSAERASQDANDIRQASDDLSAQTATLKERVTTFLHQVGDREEDADDELIEWTPAISVGNTTIDEEHRKLIGVINTLYRAVKKDEGLSAVEAAYREMRDYTDYHFTHEQELMKSSDYPQYEQHKGQHDAFIKRLEGMFEDYRSGGQQTGIDLMSLLGSWWTTHINTSDKALGAFLGADQAEKDRTAAA